MSHFGVAVVVPADRINWKWETGDPLPAHLEEDTLRVMLAPFDEATEDERFLEFTDEEDQFLQDYDTETVRRVRMPDGRLLNTHDEAFRVPGTFGIVYGGRPAEQSHRVPAGLEIVDIPVREFYATFDEFCKKYHGRTRDPDKGRVGCWRNPNAKWDYWGVRDEWHMLPVGDRMLAAARVGDIDMAAVNRISLEKAEEFWLKWMAFREHEPADGYDRHCMRDSLLDLGLIEVVKQPTPEQKARGRRWGDTWCQDDRADWYDVYSEISRTEFLESFLCRFNPTLAYAFLDSAGWHEPGHMGWFSFTDATTATFVEYAKAWEKALCSYDLRDVILYVDCHV